AAVGVAGTGQAEAVGAGRAASARGHAGAARRHRVRGGLASASSGAGRRRAAGGAAAATELAEAGHGERAADHPERKDIPRRHETSTVKIPTPQAGLPLT